MARRKKETEDNLLQSFAYKWNKKALTAFDPEDVVLKPGVVPTEIIALDEALGGGIPRGRTTILYGEYSSGKTFLSQLIIAAAQRQGGNAIFLDAERTFDPDWFRLTGVSLDEDKLLVVRPRTLEQTNDMVVDALQSVKPTVLVVDSIPALVPAEVLKMKMEEKDERGIHPRKMGMLVKNCTSFNDSTALIFINQLRTSMGITFGNPESLPGGKAIQYAASLMIRVRRGKWLTDAVASVDEEEDKEANRIGFALKLRTEKNKLAPPWKTVEVDFKFDGSIDPTGSLIRLAIERGVIQVTSPGYFQIHGFDNKIHGLDTLKAELRFNEELCALIVKMVQDSNIKEPF